MLPQSLEAATIRMMRQGSVTREIFGGGIPVGHEVGLWDPALINWEGKFQASAA